MSLERTIAQLLAHDLPGRIPGQLIYEGEVLRSLISCEVPVQMGADAGLIQVTAIGDDYVGGTCLAPPFVWYCDDGTGADLVEFADGCFDLGRIDVLATRDDQVLDPADDVRPAAGVDADDVPGAEPSIDKGPPGGLRLVPVPGEDVGSLHEQLALTRAVDDAAFRSEQLDIGEE